MLPSRQEADREQDSGPRNHLLGDGSAACEGIRGHEGWAGVLQHPGEGRRQGSELRKGRVRRALPAPGRFAGGFVDATKYKLEVPISYSLLTQVNQ